MLDMILANMGPCGSGDGGVSGGDHGGRNFRLVICLGTLLVSNYQTMLVSNIFNVVRWFYCRLNTVSLMRPGLAGYRGRYSH